VGRKRRAKNIKSVSAKGVHHPALGHRRTDEKGRSRINGAGQSEVIQNKKSLSDTLKWGVLKKKNSKKNSKWRSGKIAPRPLISVALERGKNPDKIKKSDLHKRSWYQGGRGGDVEGEVLGKKKAVQHAHGALSGRERRKPQRE